VLKSISGCIGVSPHLLSQAPAAVPQILLRGVISPDVVRMSEDTSLVRNNWVVFSGTHSKSKGLQQLIAAWKQVQPRTWELHIAGHGELTSQLERDAAGDQTIVFHGLLSREQNARLLRQSKIGINPHESSQTPGNIFAFKIIEYLAAGAHVITTPMGALERELENGLTYVQDNSPETIAASLLQVIQGREFERTAMDAARRLYGPSAVSAALDALLSSAISRTTRPVIANPSETHT